MGDNGSSRGKSEFLKRLTTGKTLCSEVNKASSNAKFLHMRRHKAFVAQLESAKQSMLVENDRAQRDMRKQLDVYKRRKRCIFRGRILQQQQQQQSSEDEDQALPSWTQRSGTSLSSRSGAAAGGGGGGPRSSVFSVGMSQPSTLGNMGSLLPTILRLPIMASDDENLHTALQRQAQQQMHKQETLHAQVLRSRVHDFCMVLEGGLQAIGGGGHGFFVTNPRRRIAFSDTVGTSSVPLPPASPVPATAAATAAAAAAPVVTGSLVGGLPKVLAAAVS